MSIYFIILGITNQYNDLLPMLFKKGNSLNVCIIISVWNQHRAMNWLYFLTLEDFGEATWKKYQTLEKWDRTLNQDSFTNYNILTLCPPHSARFRWGVFPWSPHSPPYCTRRWSHPESPRMECHQTDSFPWAGSRTAVSSRILKDKNISRNKN